MFKLDFYQPVEYAELRSGYGTSDCKSANYMDAYWKVYRLQ